MHNEPDLNKLLDRALQAYTEHEPQIGLDSRVLRRLQQPRPKRWRWAAIPALAMAALVVLTIMNRPVLQPREENAVPSPVAKGAVPTVVKGVVQRNSNRPSQTNTRIPQLAPPEPPTDQQRALQLLATQYPEQAGLMARQVPDELTIEPLAVEPLALNSLDQ